MRKSRVIAVVVASLVSSASFAQAQSAAPTAQAAPHEMRGGMRGERGPAFALRGIMLSDAEKANLEAMRVKYAAERKSLRDSLKPAIEEAREARQKGDTAAAKAVWKRNKGAREQVKALRIREQADIRAALTPEHQQLFDANVAQRAEHRAKHDRTGGHAARRRANG